MTTFQTMATDIDGYIGELNSLPHNKVLEKGMEAKVADYITGLQSIQITLIELANIKKSSEMLHEIVLALAELTYEGVGRVKQSIRKVEELSPASSKICRELIRYVDAVNYGDMTNFEKNLRRIQIIMRQHIFEQLAIMDKKESYITRVSRGVTG